jgi:hypothetical protein
LVEDLELAEWSTVTAVTTHHRISRSTGRLGRLILSDRTFYFHGVLFLEEMMDIFVFMMSFGVINLFEC